MIHSLRLQHIRSYTDGSFEFDSGVNIIVGQNASGKTTLLEAMLVCLQGRSFKGSDAEMLQTGADWGRVDLGLAADERVFKIQLSDGRAVKQFIIDDQEYSRLSALKQQPVVLFEPNHLLLLHGQPELRRTFLDDLAAQIAPGYDSVRRHYKRVLAQRNALLKQANGGSRGANNSGSVGGALTDQLFVWNLRLSELGGRIAAERLALVERFNEVISELYSQVADSPTKVGLDYRTSVPTGHYESSLLHKLERSTERDLLLGFTSSGPHREDFSITLAGQSAAETASRGEIRTLVLVLTMLQAQFIEEARGDRPVLLLDDVFSELDGRRRQALVSFLAAYQSFITTTDADVAIKNFANQCQLIALKKAL